MAEKTNMLLNARHPGSAESVGREGEFVVCLTDGIASLACEWGSELGGQTGEGDDPFAGVVFYDDFAVGAAAAGLDDFGGGF